MLVLGLHLDLGECSFRELSHKTISPPNLPLPFSSLTPSFTLESRLGVLGVVVTGRVGLQDVSGSASAVVSTSTSTGLLGSLGSGNLSGGLGCLGGLLGLDGSLDGGGGRAVVCEAE